MLGPGVAVPGVVVPGVVLPGVGELGVVVPGVLVPLPAPVAGIPVAPGALPTHGSIAVADADAGGVVEFTPGEVVLPAPVVALPGRVDVVFPPVRVPAVPDDVPVVLGDVPVVPTDEGEVDEPAAVVLPVVGVRGLPTVFGLVLEPRGDVPLLVAVTPDPVELGPVLGVVVVAPAELPAGTQGTVLVFDPGVAGWVPCCGVVPGVVGLGVPAGVD